MKISRKKPTVHPFLIVMVIHAICLLLAQRLMAADPIDTAASTAEIVNCQSEIQKSEKIIASQGADGVSAVAAQNSAQLCAQEFNSAEAGFFGELIESCDSSFEKLRGTAVKAMQSICHMRAAQFVLSLQLK